MADKEDYETPEDVQQQEPQQQEEEKNEEAAQEQGEEAEQESSPVEADQQQPPAASPTKEDPPAPPTSPSVADAPPPAVSIPSIVPPVALHQRGGLKIDDSGALVSLVSPSTVKSARSVRSSSVRSRSCHEGEVTIQSIREQEAIKHHVVNDLRRDVARAQTAAIDVLGKAAYAATFALTDDGKVIPTSARQKPVTSPMCSPRVSARETAKAEMEFGIVVLGSPEFMSEVPDPVHSARAAKEGFKRAKIPTGIAANKALAALRAQDARMHTTIPSDFIRKPRGTPRNRT